MVATEMRNRDNIGENICSGLVVSLIMNLSSDFQNSKWGI